MGGDSHIDVSVLFFKPSGNYSPGLQIFHTIVDLVGRSSPISSMASPGIDNAQDLQLLKRRSKYAVFGVRPSMLT